MATTLLEKTNTVTNPGAVYNYLRPNAFRFVIKDIPHVAYTCQSANLPSISIGFATQQTPFVDIPTIGDKAAFADFTIRFLIAEDMVNYIELVDWLVALGFPFSYTDYPRFIEERFERFPFLKLSNGDTKIAAYSDATLTILNSANQPQTNVFFKDLFPVSVEALDFDVTSSAVEYFVGIASFKYRSFNIEPV